MATVSEKYVMDRINEKLLAEGEYMELRADRLPYAYNRAGSYYIVNCYNNSLARYGFDTLDNLAAEFKVLCNNETIDYEESIA